jgi:hypothetical protein
LINNKVEPKNITILDANPTVYQDNFQDVNQYADLKVVGGTTYMDDLDSYDGIIKTP